jgi:hypothetical protein
MESILRRWAMFFKLSISRASVFDMMRSRNYSFKANSSTNLSRYEGEKGSEDEESEA